LFVLIGCARPVEPARVVPATVPPPADAAPTPAAATPATSALSPLPEGKLVLRVRTDQPTSHLLVEDGNDPVLGGPHVLYFARGARPYLLGSDTRLAEAADPSQSRFSPDGTWLALATYDVSSLAGTLQVVEVASRRVVWQQADATDPLWTSDSRLLVRHHDALLAVDPAAGVASPLGDVDLGCAVLPGPFSPGQAVRSHCPGKRWTVLLWMDPSGTRWAHAEVVEEGGHLFVESVQVVEDGRASPWYVRASADEQLRLVRVSDDGQLLCVERRSTTSGRGDVACGLRGAAMRSLVRADADVVRGFDLLGGAEVLIAARPGEPPAVVDLRTGRRTELELPHGDRALVRVLSPRSLVVVTDNTYLVDLAAGTYVEIGARNVSALRAGSGSGRLLVPSFDDKGLRHQLFEVVVP